MVLLDFVTIGFASADDADRSVIGHMRDNDDPVLPGRAESDFPDLRVGAVVGIDDR